MVAGKKENPFLNDFGRFDETPANDPFQDSTVAPADAGAWTAGRDSAWGGSPATIPLNNGPSSGGGIQMDVMRRQEQLDLKEKELNAREAELKKQQEQMIKDGTLKPKKNWPRCYPITHHDIPGDIPPETRRMVTYCYWAFLGFFVTITFNWFGSLMALCVINPGSGRIVGFLLANIYWFAGLPGAWILWYMRIYNLAQKDRALWYAWFFLMFAVHIAFCVWSAVSPPLPFINDWSHTGFVTSVKAFGSNTFVGVVYVIGGALWSLESLWSIWAMITVYRQFRSGGGPKQMKKEATREAARQAVGRSNFGAGDV